MIGIVNYNAGNITSVERALRFIGAKFITSSDPLSLDKCDRLIFPGVGDAKFAMESLHSFGLDDFLRDYVKSARKLLGICLGSQIIFDYSEESDTKCLGLIAGCVKHLSKITGGDGVSGCGSFIKEGRCRDKAQLGDRALKIPQIGWNDLTYCNGSASITRGVKDNSDYYFVHSYYIEPLDKSVVKGFCNYGGEVPALIECGNICATQFHPEKSGGCGLRLLRNFCED